MACVLSKTVTRWSFEYHRSFTGVAYCPLSSKSTWPANRLEKALIIEVSSTVSRASIDAVAPPSWTECKGGLLRLARQIVNEHLASLVVHCSFLAQQAHGFGRCRPPLNIPKRVPVCRHDFEDFAGIQGEDFLSGFNQRIGAILATHIQDFGGLKSFVHGPLSGGTSRPPGRSRAPLRHGEHRRVRF